jgi:ribosomal protein S27AE
MEALNSILVLLNEPLVQFFIWIAVIYIIASVFVDRRVAFWIGMVGASFFWVKTQDPRVAVEGWVLVLAVLLLVFLIKKLFHLNVVLFLKGRKRCPQCWETAHRKAYVCPHCGYQFSPQEETED